MTGSSPRRVRSWWGHWLGRPTPFFFALLVFGPRSAWGQWEFGPRLGLYVPVGALVDEPAAPAVPGARGVEKRQVGSIFLGLRTTVWLARRVGVEGNVAISPSFVAVSDSTGTHDKVANVVLTDVRGLLSLTPGRSVYVGAGIGLIDRNGAVWAGTPGTTRPALLLSAGARTPIRSPMSMRIEVEDHISTAELDQAQPGRVRPHHDFLWSIGVVIPIRRHR